MLDEPANGLDPHGVVWLRELLRGFAAEGRTVLVSSHVLAEMQQLVDDVVIVNEGKLVGQAGLAELVGRHGSLERAFFDLLDETETEGSRCGA